MLGHKLHKEIEYELGTRASSNGVVQGDLGLAVFDSAVSQQCKRIYSNHEGQLAITKLANIPDDTVIGRAQGDSSQEM